MNKLAKARKLVADYPITEELKQFGQDNIGTYAEENTRLLYYNGIGTKFLVEELSCKVLAESLHYFIGIDEQEIKKDEQIKLGSSKLKGKPHLPRHIIWPEGFYFLAQFNFAELSAYDLLEYLPKKGILYLFFDTESEVKAIYFNGDLNTLEIREYPNKNKFLDTKYYYDNFAKKPCLIKYEPNFIFFIGSSEDYDINSILPNELVEAVAKEMGYSIAEYNPSTNLFGRPHYWQGEDEIWPDDETTLSNSRLLLYQEEFGEGHIHIWIDKKAAKEGDFSELELTYSGT